MAGAEERQVGGEHRDCRCAYLGQAAPQRGDGARFGWILADERYPVR